MEQRYLPFVQWITLTNLINNKNANLKIAGPRGPAIFK